MQRADPSLAWPNVLYLAIVGILGYLVRAGHQWLVLWLNRNKPKAEIDETEARTLKTHAEARKINAEATSELDEIIERLHARINQMQVKVDELRDERDEFKMRVDLQQIDLTMRDADIKKLKGILDAKGIKPSDFNEPKS